MSSKIGINIICYTAREQNILVTSRECKSYYSDAYNGSIRNRIVALVSEFVDCNIEISAQTSYLKDGYVANAIIIELFNENGYDKAGLKSKLRKYISGYFTKQFKSNNNE